ncbi:MAG: hypothetical protein WC662_00295 [Candidatus Paceibacterota bacterium]|jgi:hypothetical protein
MKKIKEMDRHKLIAIILFFASLVLAILEILGVSLILMILGIIFGNLEKMAEQEPEKKDHWDKSWWD